MPSALAVDPDASMQLGMAVLRSQTPGEFDPVVSHTPQLTFGLTSCERERCAMNPEFTEQLLTIYSTVMRYLDGMAKSGNTPTNTPPRSLVAGSEYAKSQVSQGDLLSPSMRQKYLGGDGNAGHEGGDEEDDADSTEQVGQRSALGLQSENGDIPLHEPGPNDPPGPKYESYDSGPSFGNFGPMPTEDRASINPPFTNSWNVCILPGSSRCSQLDRAHSLTGNRSRIGTHLIYPGTRTRRTGVARRLKRTRMAVCPIRMSLVSAVRGVET